MKCIIVEDEPLALERTREFVQKLPHLQLIAAFDNSLDALAFLRTHNVDLLFLDIQMDELTGIQLLEAVDVQAQIIITSAYSEYALKGYELRVTDYLLKPFTFARFVQAVERAHENHSRHTQAEKKFIFVKTEYRLEKIMLDELLYIEGMRDYRRIHTTKTRIMTLQTFGELEQEIPPHIALRVHKSYMVALGRIDSVERERIRIGEVLIPISDTYRETFWQAIGTK
ncbi:MAG: response regulator transcription factor [Bacteroidetes bacterium]|nr:response regulator transcription factor [Bacteroidota bacterium]